MLLEIALQGNEEANNVHQDDHTRTSGPRPKHLLDVSSHSLGELHIIEEVDIEELSAPPSNRHEEMFSTDLESNAHI